MRQRRFHPAIIIFSLSLCLYLYLFNRKRLIISVRFIFSFFFLLFFQAASIDRATSDRTDTHTQTTGCGSHPSKKWPGSKQTYKKKKTNKSSNVHKRNILKKFQNQIKSPSMIYFDLEYQIQSLIQFLFFFVLILGSIDPAIESLPPTLG